MIEEEKSKRRLIINSVTEYVLFDHVYLVVRLFVAELEARLASHSFFILPKVLS